MWIKENLNNFNEIDKFIDFSTYIYSKWFENPSFNASYSISSWSGLFDRNKLEWHSELIKYLGISEENLPIGKQNPENKPTLKEAGFLTRDSRVKESKKYGLVKARKAKQFSKR